MTPKTSLSTLSCSDLGARRSPVGHASTPAHPGSVRVKRAAVRTPEEVFLLLRETRGLAAAVAVQTIEDHRARLTTRGPGEASSRRR